MLLQVTIGLLKNAMLKSRSNMFLVDGFPRALDQAETFERDILPCQTVSQLFCQHACRVPGMAICLTVKSWLH